MKRFFWHVIAALGCLPALLRAEPMLSFGPDVPLFVTAAASVRRDDNVTLAPRDGSADTIFVLVPGLDLHVSGGKAKAGIVFNEQFVRYSTNRQLNDDLASVAGDASYTGSETKMSVNASYQQEDQSTLTASNYDQTLKQSLTGAAADVETRLAPKTSVGVGTSFVHTTYPGDAFSNNSALSIPIDLYYAVTPKVDLSMGYDYGRTTFANPLDDSKSNFFNVGARGDFTPKLSGQVRLGTTELKPEQGPADRQFGLGASLDYLFSPRTSFDLTASNGFGSSPLGSSQELLTIVASGHFELTQAWAATAGLSFSSTKYLIVPARRDDFWLGSAGLVYTWTTETAFELVYYYRTNASTLAAADFSNNVLTFSATSRF